MRKAKSPGIDVNGQPVPAANDFELESEGEYTELERRLWAADRLRKAMEVEQKFPTPSFQPGRSQASDLEGESDPEGNGIQYPVWENPRSGVEGPEQIGERTDAGASNWQDYESSEPANSNHQDSRSQRILSGRESRSNVGKPAVKKAVQPAKARHGKQNHLQNSRKKNRSG